MLTRSVLDEYDRDFPMMNVSIENLPVFLRVVREAQGISQRQLAVLLGVSSPAIAQYEKSARSLSKAKILALAPLVNLNPQFIEQGVGNPFKQRDKKKIIKMHFQTSPFGEIDPVLLKPIFEYNDKAVFLLLKPTTILKSTVKNMNRNRSGNADIYALLIQDSDGNRFLFKQKNDALFDGNSVRSMIEENVSSDKRFRIETVDIPLSTYEKIHSWDDLTDKDVEPILTSYLHKDDIEILQELVDVFSAYSRARKEKGQMDSIRGNIQKLNPKIVSAALESEIPDFVDRLNKRLAS